MFGKTELKMNKHRDGRHCDLCGCSFPAVRCDKCSSQIFCLSCDDMYHRHPKRKFHLRKAVDPTPTPQARPVLPMKASNLALAPGDPSKMPLPPPRKKKPGKSIFDSFRRGSPANDTSPTLPKKEYSWTDRLGSITKFMSNRPLPPVPDDDDNNHPTVDNDHSDASHLPNHNLSFIHRRVDEKPPALPQRQPRTQAQSQFQGFENGENINTDPVTNMTNGNVPTFSGTLGHNIDRNQSWIMNQQNLKQNDAQGFGTLRRQSQPQDSSSRPPADKPSNMHQSSSVTDLTAVSDMPVGPLMQPYPPYPFNPHFTPAYPYPVYPQYPPYPQYFGNSWANLASHPSATDQDFSDQSESSSRRFNRGRHKSHMEKKAKRSQSVMVDRMAYPGQFHPFGPFPPGYPSHPWMPAHSTEAPPSPAVSLRSLSRLNHSHRRKKVTDDDDDDFDDFSSSPLSRPKSSSSEISKSRMRAKVKSHPTSSSSEHEDESKSHVKPKASPLTDRKHLKQQNLKKKNSSPRRSSLPRKSESEQVEHEEEHGRLHNKQQVPHSCDNDSELSHPDASSTAEKVSQLSLNDARPSPVQRPAEINQQLPSSSWQCKHCTFINSVEEHICQVCCKTAYKSESPTDQGEVKSSEQNDSTDFTKSTASSEVQHLQNDNENADSQDKHDIAVLNSALAEAEKQINQSLEELLKVKEESSIPEVETTASKQKNDYSVKHSSSSNDRYIVSSPKAIENMQNLSPNVSLDNVAQSNVPTSQCTPSSLNSSDAKTSTVDSNVSFPSHNSVTSYNVGQLKDEDAIGSSKQVPVSQSGMSSGSETRKDSFCQTYQDITPDFVPQNVGFLSDGNFGPSVLKNAHQPLERADFLQSTLPYNSYQPQVQDRGFGNGYGGMQRAHSRASLFGGRVNDAMPSTHEYGGMGIGFGPSPMYRSLSRASLLGEAEGWGGEYTGRPKPDFYLSMEELVERRRQDTMRAQGLELVRMIREAEQQGFTADDIQVALNNCGKHNPVNWLQENWKNLIRTVVTLATNYGKDKRENDVGVVSDNEARDALRLHKGNIWAAVTECVEGRQRKFLELSARGNFTFTEITDALTESEGDVEIAYAKLTNTTLKPFLMRIWGSGEGVPNLEGALQPLPPLNKQYVQSDNCSRNMSVNEENDIIAWEDDYGDEADWEDEAGEVSEEEHEASLGLSSQEVGSFKSDEFEKSEKYHTLTRDNILSPESDKSDYCDAFGSGLGDRYLSSTSIDEIYLIDAELDEEDTKSESKYSFDEEDPKKRGVGFLSKLAALRKDTTRDKIEKSVNEEVVNDMEERNQSFENTSLPIPTLDDGLKEANKKTELSSDFRPLKILKETITSAKTEKNSPSIYDRRTIVVHGRLAHETVPAQPPHELYKKPSYESINSLSADDDLRKPSESPISNMQDVIVGNCNETVGNNSDVNAVFPSKSEFSESKIGNDDGSTEFKGNESEVELKSDVSLLSSSLSQDLSRSSQSVDADIDTYCAFKSGTNSSGYQLIHESQCNKGALEVSNDCVEIADKTQHELELKKEKTLIAIVDPSFSNFGTSDPTEESVADISGNEEPESSLDDNSRALSSFKLENRNTEVQVNAVPVVDDPQTKIEANFLGQLLQKDDNVQSDKELNVLINSAESLNENFSLSDGVSQQNHLSETVADLPVDDEVFILRNQDDSSNAFLSYQVVGNSPLSELEDKDNEILHSNIINPLIEAEVNSTSLNNNITDYEEKVDHFAFDLKDNIVSENKGDFTEMNKAIEIGDKQTVFIKNDDKVQSSNENREIQLMDESEEVPIMNKSSEITVKSESNESVVQTENSEAMAKAENKEIKKKNKTKLGQKKTKSKGLLKKNESKAMSLNNESKEADLTSESKKLDVKNESEEVYVKIENTEDLKMDANCDYEMKNGVSEHQIYNENNDLQISNESNSIQIENEKGISQSTNESNDPQIKTENENQVMVESTHLQEAKGNRNDLVKSFQTAACESSEISPFCTSTNVPLANLAKNDADVSLENTNSVDSEGNIVISSEIERLNTSDTLDSLKQPLSSDDNALTESCEVLNRKFIEPENLSPETVEISYASHLGENTVKLLNREESNLHAQSSSVTSLNLGKLSEKQPPENAHIVGDVIAGSQSHSPSSSSAVNSSNLSELNEKQQAENVSIVGDVTSGSELHSSSSSSQEVISTTDKKNITEELNHNFPDQDFGENLKKSVNDQNFNNTSIHVQNKSKESSFLSDAAVSTVSSELNKTITFTPEENNGEQLRNCDGGTEMMNAENADVVNNDNVVENISNLSIVPPTEIEKQEPSFASAQDSTELKESTVKNDEASTFSDTQKLANAKPEEKHIIHSDAVDHEEGRNSESSELSHETMDEEIMKNAASKMTESTHDVIDDGANSFSATVNLKSAPERKSNYQSDSNDADENDEDISLRSASPVRPVGHLRRMSFNTRREAIFRERNRDSLITEQKPWFLQKKVEPFKPTFPKRSIKQQLEFERKVRQLVADRKCRTYRKAEIIVQLLELKFEETEAIYAANECSNLDQAISFLQQECQLCTGKYPVGEIVSMVHCSHKACKECIKAYFTIQIRDRTIMELLCPFCNEPDITDEDIAQDYFNHLDIMLKKLVDFEIHELFQRKLRDRVLMKDPNFRWCSQCSSGFIADPYLKRLICPDCNAITCATCRRLWEREHEGVSCEAFAVWKDANDPESQTAGLAKLLTEDGIDCPSCHFRYALAKGGCMHFKCIQCQHDFCSGCSKPFKMGKKCGLSEFCAKLGLHAHHPRNCLFYLRDKEPEDLRRLLDMNGIEYNKGSPSTSELKALCDVMEQKETSHGMVDDICGKDVEEGFAGLCRVHYVEYLGQLVNKYKIDPIQIFGNDDLELVLKRASIRLPPKKYRESETEYRNKLVQLIEERLPLGDVEGS